ncbi:MAG: hypothetical protein NW241_23565 [Bacteroidia bacterium]|nr:hypothetical protein [Bacteroidia bacterium]
MELIIFPEEKLNQLAQQISDRLMNEQFIQGGMVHGEALKNFTSHPQVNKFLVFQVFQVWETQLSKLRHPFFQTDHPDVQDAIQTLRNLVSRHIAIPRDEFQPLLARAVYNHLRLILDPRGSLEAFFFSQKDEISATVYQRYAQFFSYMDFVVNSIQKFMEKNQMQTITRAEFLAKMEKVVGLYNQKSGSSFDAYRNEALSALTGKSADELTAELRSAQAELEARRQAEEAARVAEAARLAEEARRAEEAARQAAEAEARRRAEEEARRQNFFDTLDTSNTFFDLDDDSAAPPAPRPEPVRPEPVAEVPAPRPEPVRPEPVAEVPAPRPEPVRPEPVAEVPAPKPEPVRPEPVAEVPAPKPEPVRPEPVAEVPAPRPEPVRPEPVAEVPAPKPEPVKPDPAVQQAVEASAQEVDEFLEMASSLEPKKPKDPESTATFLDRFLASKQQEPSQKPGTILDRLSEKTQRPLSEPAPGAKPLADALNGNRKIKLDEIPIHKQYQYVQKVFEGNNVRFRIIVDKVNNARNKEEVEEILDKFVLNNSTLNVQDPVAEEFIQLLRNRF